ncbi:MAG: DUF3124 domain-containing protein [Candidatus Hydrogenedentes bacterium]|nr:DUF3124 domain-containing protein [Candidatus Hydrogenedentota bacterium]
MVYLILGIGLIVIVPIAVLGYFVDHQFSSFEREYRYRAPEASGTVAPPLAEATAGQTVYVPAYSHVYHQEGDPYLLTITLSVRNTDQESDIVVERVRYFDSAGSEIRSFLQQPLKLGPMATSDFLVTRKDTSGGSGASFLVDWAADRAVSAPVIEAVMIDTTERQGISFVRSGVVVGSRESSKSEPERADGA